MLKAFLQGICRRSNKHSMVRFSSESGFLLTLALIQCVNIADFMFIMPLGADMVQSAVLRTADLGSLSAAYKSAAILAALGSALFIERLPRPLVLLCALMGLLLGMLGLVLAHTFAQLLAARVLAGLCSGPLTAVVMALIFERVAQAQRGRALVWVMSAFPLVLLLGVPAALEIAQLGTWRSPFWLLMGLGIVAFISSLRLPQAVSAAPLRLSVPAPHGYRWLYLSALLTAFSSFLILPLLPLHMQINLGWGREHLSQLYLLAGISGLLALQWGKGFLKDKPLELLHFSSLLLAASLYLGFFAPVHAWTAPLFIASFSASLSLRSLSLSAYLGQQATRRYASAYARFSLAQHLGAALGSGLSTTLVLNAGSGGFNAVLVAWLALVSSLLLPLLMRQSAWRLLILFK